ncbi:MATE family efflux transporter [Algoriphagus resistens]|uniref:hypothetical protein n=1 Tax=Algoriphagus resistens TaxID=1750590 RepID=UPI000716BF68|nr:hypothetical protein [Algoriphagus resistens]
MLKSVSSSFLWSGIGFVFNKVGLIGLLSVLSFVLNKDDYSDFNLFIISSNVFSGVFGASMSITANRYGIGTPGFSLIRKMCFAISLISSVVFFLYSVLLKNSIDLDFLIYEILIIFFTTFLTSINGLYYANNNFKGYAYLNIIYGILYFSLGYIGAYFYELIGLFIGLNIAGLFFCIFSFFYLKPSLINNSDIQDSSTSLLVKRSIKNVLVPNIISGFLFQPAILISAHYLNNAADGDGLIAYSLANQFRMIGGFYIVVSGSVLMKLLVDNLAISDLRIERFNYTFSYYPYLGLVFLILSLLKLSNIFFNLTDSYLLYRNLYILLLASVITAFKSSIARKLVSSEEGKISIFSNLTWFILFIVFNYFLIKEWASVGASAAFLLANLFQLIIWAHYYYSKGILNISFFDFKFYISLLLIIISVFVFFSGFYYLNFILSLVCFYFTYTEIQKFKTL